MKEELQKQLAQIIAAIHGQASSTGDFWVERLPSVAQQYIAYGRAQAIIDIIMPVLGLLLAAWLIKHERMHFGAPLDIKSKGARISVLINTVAAGLGTYSVIMFVNATHAAALVWSAPKVWLLRELANIIK
ncbi:hypothetical protein [Delftia acidovorans]|uniref:Uncharacterized protein n=1 Tax=Delftia acidovorans TaxID=80866 RepID=A0AAJ2VCA3_DELAC|nr:hypothetical protein [Delftia acidovorans]MDX4958200.1 hypothetical protein [Delftia acidovorans]